MLKTEISTNPRYFELYEINSNLQHIHMGIYFTLIIEYYSKIFVLSKYWNIPNILSFLFLI